MSLFPQEQLQADFSKLNKLIYGFPKSGKTTFASLMRCINDRPPLFIATEEGHGALSLHRVRVTSWAGFLKLLSFLETNANQIRSEHSAIVVDLVGDLDDMCTAYIIAQQNNPDITSLPDMEYGKGFHLQALEFKTAINRLFSILPVTFIAHSTEKEIMWNNEKIKTQCPDLTKRALSYVNGKVDLIMWIAPANSNQAKPHIIMEPSTLAIAGSRYKQLVKNYVLEPDDPGLTYQAIQKDFQDGVNPIPQKEVTNG